MRTLTTVVKDEYVELLDKAISNSKMYSSRSEFLKDAVREKLERLIRFNEETADIREGARKLALKAKARGWDGNLITKEEKEKAHQELLKKKGFI
ncbi:MAG: hypothetical protein J4415_03030 [Candidatus Diapherotrites archaeon]|uniref:Uncharacterized protein n=1 Tax=Candidatus Iainarchaeum sp. TaxID=3101447 RepID=A0A8T4KXW6_9ARCH|nr:hypothetical protein [Candidatus Diapherotrites archaeon]